jgi:calcineurin-like phosphoesterase
VRSHIYYFLEDKIHRKGSALKEEMTYFHATKNMILKPKADDNLIITCHFDTGNEKLCFGFAFERNVKEPCAGMVFIRE